MCVSVCCTFGLVSPASRSGEGNMHVRTSFFCHTGIDGLKLWSEWEWRREEETDRQRDRRTDRETERERESSGEGGRWDTVGERMGWISNLAFSTPGACILLWSHACFLSLAYLCVGLICPLFLFTYFLLCVSVPPLVPSQRPCLQVLPVNSFVLSLPPPVISLLRSLPFPKCSLVLVNDPLNPLSLPNHFCSDACLETYANTHAYTYTCNQAPQHRHS